MRIEFDVAKDASNLQKHGVSLAEALELVWEEALIWHDQRMSYGEDRQCALLPLSHRLYAVVFVDRGNVRRIISLRKANQREFDRYVTSIDTSD